HLPLHGVLTMPCRLFTFLALTLLTAPLLAQDKADHNQADKPHPSAKWEQNIAKFEQQDEAQPPVKGGVVFVGSSSIVRWDLKKAFPDLPAINRGFGGSQLADSV